MRFSELPPFSMLTQLEIAFLQGAKWEHYRLQGATMWQSDQKAAAEEAIKRTANGTLGENPLLVRRKAPLPEVKSGAKFPPERAKTKQSRVPSANSLAKP